MYTFMTLIAIVMVLIIAHVFCGAPSVIDALSRRAERLRSRGYLSMLVTWPVIIAASGYALATVAGVFFGFAAAWADMGRFFAMVFLACLVSCFFSVLGDVGSLGRSMATGKTRTGTPGVRVLSSLLFFSSMYGSLAICLLKINGIVTF